jgi:D-serine deaminase-like pyridoxal phosphate-dependent protein
MLNALLREKGPGHPVLVLDLDILDQNISVVTRKITAPGSLRVVAKSLPCLELIRHVFEKIHTRKAMVFHRPFLNLIARELPDADVLLGKPLPVKAAQTFYRQLGETSAFDAEANLQWLIDTHARLLQYQQLAHEHGIRLQVSIEIDVGLHRGGLSRPRQLSPLLEAIAGDPEHLAFTGFMGYDVQAAKSGKLFIPVEKALAQVLKRYKEFIAFVREQFPDLYSERLTFNGAGSQTYAYYENIDLLNDISVGSALVKPADFDLDSLAKHQPALFIATPVLKKMTGVNIPFLEFLTPVMKKLKRNWAATLFIYGGYWKAVPHSPPGLVTNSLYGRSTNQEMLNAAEDIAVDVDDYVFLRPTQSEWVMLQFGDLLVVRGGQIIGHWPVFSQGH